MRTAADPSPRWTPRRAGALGLALSLALAGCTGAAGGTAAPEPSPAGPERHPAGERTAARADEGDGDWIARSDDDALFTVDCGFSHRAADDPIVAPGVPGASHSHEFFGSTATDAGSTGEALRGTPTTCEDPRDTASYWVPTLSVDGVPVDPAVLRAYYRATPGADARQVVAPPVGLAMIAGDPARTAPGDGTPPGAHDPDHPADGPHHGDHGGPGAVAGGGATGSAGWGCGMRPRRLRVEPPTNCTDISPLTLQLRFPDCWDGARLDSADHRSHVAASTEGRCPASHPVPMVALQVSVVWPVTGADAARATLSSGATAGAHGDFLNGWDPDALDAHIELCIRALANCTIG